MRMLHIGVRSQEYLHVDGGVRTFGQTLPHCHSMVRTRPRQYRLLYSRDTPPPHRTFCMKISAIGEASILH